MQDEPKKTAKTATASKKKSRLQGLKAEFRRIIWPDKETITKETTAVVVSTVILGIIIALLDLLIKTGLDKVFQIG
ncbi:preprotein translocase subunit SecE [Clostridium sp. OM05-6BH]|nr:MULTISPECIES: preprotein translocase subunit SecE [unclassified Clostridium]MBS6767874.1 preprotein translocase subunit SecE [Clostridium sp.]OKZ62779.1 MAG: preprotein translocase subunit SecE [Clostridium sp. 42_12]HCK45998.1 preprotein translocase subunit SecE [Lachnospiraceae bacterium]RHQ12285.1 preprotein translocase subunit SecE [Clostridium sp. AM49-4BH]RHV16342.1 preprotein translocase subunit SecE [Clostridium sp. OM05-9BH]